MTAVYQSPGWCIRIWGKLKRARNSLSPSWVVSSLLNFQLLSFEVWVFDFRFYHEYTWPSTSISTSISSQIYTLLIHHIGIDFNFVIDILSSLFLAHFSRHIDFISISNSLSSLIFNILFSSLLNLPTNPPIPSSLPPSTHDSQKCQGHGPYYLPDR